MGEDEQDIKKEVGLYLSIEQSNQIIRRLSELRFKDVYDVIGLIQSLPKIEKG